VSKVKTSDIIIICSEVEPSGTIVISVCFTDNAFVVPLGNLPAGPS